MLPTYYIIFNTIVAIYCQEYTCHTKLEFMNFVKIYIITYTVFNFRPTTLHSTDLLSLKVHALYSVLVYVLLG